MIFVILIPMMLGVLLSVMPFRQDEKKRNAYIAVTLLITCALAIMTLFNEYSYTQYIEITSFLSIGLHADTLGKYFLLLVNVVWLMVGIYSLEYMKHEINHVRFYSFFLFSLGAMNGVCISGNFLTLYLFFEALTIASMPLVLHSQTKDAIQAAIKYLIYSIFGATMGLLGFFFVAYYGDASMFVAGGVLQAELTGAQESMLLIVCFLTTVGFGAKAGMYPLHSWLPTAHPVAPAAASSLLSGIITKAGVLAIIRIIYYQFGVEFIRGTWVQYALITLALFTVFMGSMLAYKEKIMKKRLAYSTVSQVSYILFGLFCLNAVSFLGALLHVVAHALIKNVLFMVSGAIIYKSHQTRVDRIDGLGTKMPITFGLFTIASLGLIGIPPLVGFVSKWYLASGSLSFLDASISWIGPVVLLISALLTAGYLFTITVQGFFKTYEGDDAVSEVNNTMLIPMALLVVGIIVFGFYPTLLMDNINLIIQGLF